MGNLRPGRLARLCSIFIAAGIGCGTIGLLLPGMSDAASEPLSVAELNQTPLTQHPFKFNAETVGRQLQGSSGWMAVEQYFLVLSSQPGEEFTYAEMLELESLNEINDSTTLTLGYRRALVQGDSAAVAAAIAGGQIDWEVSDPGDPYPTNSIVPIIEEP